MICSCCFLDTVCYEDKPTSSPVITTRLPSTHIPSTTVVTTTSVPPSLKPEVGQYSVNGSSGMCLRASMALQLNFTYSAQNKVHNFLIYFYTFQKIRSLQLEHLFKVSPLLSSSSSILYM